MTISYGTAAAANRFFVVVALLAAAVGVFMMLQVRLEVPGMAFVLGGFALMWFSLAGILWLSARDPIRLVAGRFDEQTRRFVLTAADGMTCALPYRDLQGFDVRRKVIKGKHSHVQYIVHLVKQDGGLWDLQSFANDGLAQELLRSLQGTVNLAAAQADDPQAANPLPDVFRRTDVDGVSRLTWKNQERFADSLFAVMLGASMVIMLLAIPGVVTGAYWLFQLFAGLIVLWIAKRNYVSRGRTFQLEISSRFLTYSTRERGGAGFQVKQVLEVAEATRLQSSYDVGLSQQERAHKLVFVGDKPDTRVELELPGIRTSDVLELEAHLQAELARRGQIVT